MERIFSALNRYSADDYKLHDRDGNSRKIINYIKVIPNVRTLTAVNCLRKECCGGVDFVDEITVTDSLATLLLNIDTNIVRLRLK